MNEIACQDLPGSVDLNAVYRLLPKNPDDAYYKERTDRHLGWITQEEQQMLRESTVGIAGCGGMGGLIAATLMRLGIGGVRIADCEVFDASNINRQFAGTRNNIGVSKAFATARMIRDITDDTTLTVFPQGITEETVDPFLQGLDVVCDEIEFWAIGARILLHQEARKKGVSLFNCNTVGFGTRLFYFEPDGFTMEQTLGFTYEDAKALQIAIQQNKATPADIKRAMGAVLTGLVPMLPEYSAEPLWSNRDDVCKRLFEEGRAAIIATNPPMASGFLANHILFHLLRTKSKTKRDLALPMPMPGFLFFDAGTHTANRVERKTI
ncbi:MAG TPA: ThiF family adenylyltransferase [Candidatus Paceibacterota bacterium]|nr:ThiF family adenylyltransferase [Candidatus Paceibacterota bacterium]